MERWQKVTFAVLGILVVGMGAFVGGYAAATRTQEARTIAPDEHDAALRIIRDAYDEIRSSAVEQPNEEELARGAVRGMVRVLKQEEDDPYALFYSPKAYNSFQELTTGRFSGIGVWLKKVRDDLQVVSVLPESPASAAGLQAGDVIHFVDGRDVDDMTDDEAVARIKGRAGTEVELRIERGGDSIEFTITRRELELPSVQASLEEGDVGYLRLVTFARGAGDDVREQVERLIDRGAEGILLDMRDNGGGLFDEAVEVASVFIEDGDIVAYESRSEGDDVYEAAGDAFADVPLVVLVNGGTASASEIVAAALQHHERAPIVGTTTYGKGSVQQLIPLLDGSALKLTTAAYLTPDGESIDGTGIEPDIDVDETANEQERRAISILRGLVTAMREPG